MEVLIGISCFILGCIITRFIFRAKPIGTLVVDESDPEDGPYLFLESRAHPQVIKNMKHVVLNVDVRNYISQK